MQQSGGAPVQHKSGSETASSPFDGVSIDDARTINQKYVLAQARQDLFGTKDVQDAITVSYVWLADQVGHITLGLVPTAILCWAFQAAWDRCLFGVCTHGAWLRPAGMAAIAVAVLAYWYSKERTDYGDCWKRKGDQFPFNGGDIWWNVYTALVYFACGAIFAAAAFIGPLWLLASIALLIWPALRIVQWWLRRKIAFQQAALPFLFRLANFKSKLTSTALAACTGIANLQDRRVSYYSACFGPDSMTPNAPAMRHILLTGPLGSGKTSLAVGIGTEFAFGLGIGRYLTAAKLVQSLADTKNLPQQMENDDGRQLWPLRLCDLLIVDDLDAGVSVPSAGALHLIHPEDFLHAMEMSNAPLNWLGTRRSIWIIGDSSQAAAWIATIAQVMQVDRADVLQVDLVARPLQQLPPR